ncbi:diacylglycerol/lipid kinase family protein [Cyclobacterium amurskyense]|uniref:Diacylglycerol kinase catalytic region n=1 Tax=Cyclobacterium amurskyense TaxID=320787 RepID=A0A0H4PM57_9BACT|nr:diacylglycerol kinase family protein [Cyclobacterium amurskyense]AKP54168.1 Diacylglycerol kinase catalytic region [Cyclobacterium amurskyense]|tara:strand:+ start:86 stop:982 length:897 start_codon:yes stop_codon:yes gene_type:complete
MKLLFIVNPISGDVDKEPFIKNAKELCLKYGIENRFFKTTGKDDEEKVNDIIQKFVPDRVASVGGDGTTLFSAIALMEEKIPMGIIPLGSANGMAVELGVNSNPIEALKDLIMSSMIKSLDMLKINDKYYSLHIGDVGINAEIVASYEKDSNRGMTTYAKYFLDELMKIDPFEIQVEANNENTIEKAVMVGICNSRKYGTGIPLNINGNPMDGKFEIVLVKNLNTQFLINAGLSKFNDVFYMKENITAISTEKAILKFDHPRLLQLDGEVIGKFDRLVVEIVKGATMLITSKDNQYID